MAHDNLKWAVKQLKELKLNCRYENDRKALEIAIEELQISIDNQ
jgi:hypothetical protein